MNFTLSPLIWWPFGIVAVLLAALVLWRVKERRSAWWPADRNDNGVRVGEPKVYDNRSLTLMLEQLREQLRSLQSIDNTALNASLGTQQGQTSTEIDVSGTLGAKAPAGDGKNAAKPAAPDAPLKWSERAPDLLDDQINLSYQIFNLRLLLERAISDRLIGADTRMQAVLGLPISIDPPPFAVGCVCTVEVLLKLAGGGRPSLVALFPQEQTYNTWNVDRRRYQASGGADYAGVPASANASAGSQAAYLRRQADIVAIEREPANHAEKDSLIVAWQFRPAPGERTVAAGLRQLLAVVSLPKADRGRQNAVIEVRIRSTWRTWNPSSGTAGRTAGWRALLSNRPSSHLPEQASAVDVPTTENLESTLQPTLTGIQYFAVGQDQAAVVVTGTNFFTGTSVIMGGKTFDADHGLTIKSEQTLQVMAPLSALASDALLNGRYGSPVPMRLPPAVPPLYIRGVWMDPKPGNDSYEGVVDFATLNGTTLTPEQWAQIPSPILTINGKLILNPLVMDQLLSPREWITTRALVGAEIIGEVSSVIIRAAWPFCGPDWLLDYQGLRPGRQISAFRYPSGDKIAIVLTGRNFSQDVKVFVDQDYSLGPPEGGSDLVKLADDLLRIELDPKIVDSHPEFFVREPNAASVVVQIPRVDAKPGAPPAPQRPPSNL